MRTLAMPKTAEQWSQLAREADQDPRQGREPRPLHDLSDGRGRGAATDVPGNLDVDRPTSGAAGTNVTGR